jgi:hypothetical protein
LDSVRLEEECASFERAQASSTIAQAVESREQRIVSDEWIWSGATAA